MAASYLSQRHRSLGHGRVPQVTAVAAKTVYVFRRELADAMTTAEIGILSALIAVVVVSLWLGFRGREF